MKLRFGLDDRPNFGALCLYGLQWLMIAIPVVLTSTFIAPAGETVVYTQKLFALMGITMILQVMWGHRMPLIAGPAAVLLMGIIAAIQQGHAADSIYPSMMIGGIIITLCAMTGILRYIQRAFTPRVVISIMLLISFTIAKPIVGMIFGDASHSLLSFILVVAVPIAMATANDLLKGVWKTMVVILSMILGSLLFYALTEFPSDFISDDHKTSLILGSMNFDTGLIIAFIFCYIALLINQAGSVQSLGEMVGADNMERRQNRGLFITGIMNIVCGAAGVIGPVDYSLSPGVVASTSCASRHTILPAAISMLVIALLPDVVAAMLTIPAPIMGIVLLYLMATQLAAGFHLIEETKGVTSFREGMILAIPIMVTVIMAFAPASVLSAIPSLLRPILGNSFVVGILTVLLLEHLFLRKKSTK